jgi:transketolase
MDNGKPTIIIAKTIIGKGIPEVEGTNAAHGEAGVPFQKTARAHLGLPADELWHVAPEVRKATAFNLPHVCSKCRSS